MRKWIARALCVLLFGLYACGIPASETAAATTQATTTAATIAALSRKDALALANRVCGDAYDMESPDFDDENGLQIHARHAENYRLLCTGPELAKDGDAYYRVRQYEFMLDNPETGAGRSLTLNVFLVKAGTDEVIPWYVYDENDERQENEAHFDIKF